MARNRPHIQAEVSPSLMARVAAAVDGMVAALSPHRAVRRAQARHVLAYYEAAKPDTQRKFWRDQRGPNMQVDQGAVALRTQVRHLEQNHDLTKGALDTLVVNTVGPAGIGVEFQPRKADGSIHTAYAKALAEAWRDFCAHPEVTGLHTLAGCQRLSARTWFRDGEVFAQRLLGPVAGLDHGTRVPYSIEMLEPDLLPHEFNDGPRGIRQSVQRNAWGKPTAYWVYKAHPGEDTLGAGLPTAAGMKAIPADRMLHLADRNRIGQLRGVTRFASVIQRIGDIKDYEESERIAAKIAAMLTAYVKRQSPDGEGYVPQLGDDGQPLPREISLTAGTIIDTLAVGEEIGLIDSKRPNPNLVTFRHGQLRAFAAGISASFSSVSKAYDGTYSAQRQELVEQWVHYACLSDDFVGMWLAPLVGDFIRVAHLSGVARRPADVVEATADDVLYIAPSMPWIDPAKEALAMLTQVRAGFASSVEMIRRRGANPDSVLQQEAEHRRKARGLGLAFDSDAALTEGLLAAGLNDGSPSGTAPAQPPANR